MKYLTLVLTLFIQICLSACSGGSGGTPVQITPTPPPAPPIAGITGTGIAMGTISSFGSVIVNGVTYNTDNATFTINGESGSQSDLSVGQVVTVNGDINADLVSGVAESVTFDDNVKGPIQSIDIANNSFVALGQTVLIDATTSFDDSISAGDLTGLAIGDLVEVSGLVDANGAIAATRIELKAAGTIFEVTGTVASHDSAAQTFMINQLVVDYSAALLDNFQNGQIENDLLVETKGTQLDAFGALTATSVEQKDNNAIGDDGDYIEVEGFITRFVNSTDFDIAGIGVITNGSTVFEGGQASDLGHNVKVEVEGTFNANKQIVAEKVDIRRAKSARIEGVIDAVDSAGGNFTILDIRIDVDALTRLEDKSDADVDPLTLSDLNVGDFMEVDGSEFPAGSGNIIAAIVERDDFDNDTILQGFVSAFSDPTITVLGVTIETASAVFRDENNAVLSRAEFFSRLDTNTLVKAKGVESSITVLVAEEVEFEIEN